MDTRDLAIFCWVCVAGITLALIIQDVIIYFDPNKEKDDDL